MQTVSSLTRVNGITCEQTLIGCCILGGTEIFLKVCDCVTSEVFKIPAFQSAFKVMSDLVRDGVEIDTASVIVEWQRQLGEFPPDSVWMSPEPEFTASAEGWPYFKSIVIEDFQKRLMADQAKKVLEASADPMTTAAETQQLMEAATVNTGVDYQTKHGSPLATSTLEKIEELFTRKGALAGVSTGFGSLDRLTDGLAPKELSVVAARPSEGKTALGLSMARMMAFHQQTSVLFISLEMPEHSIMTRLVSMETGIAFRDLRRGSLTMVDFERVKQAAVMIKEAPFGIVDASAMKVSEIGRIIRNNVKTRGVKVVIIDYIQIIRHDGKSERRTEQVAEISKELKHFSKRYNVHICALAQVNRESAKENRPPKVHEIAESDQIEKDADLVMLLHRPKDESGINGSDGALFVAKQRDGGKGKISLDFNERLVRFEDPSPIHKEDMP